MTEDDPTSFLKHVLQPLLRWMAENNTTSLLIRASPQAPVALLERPRDETDSLYYCDERPAGPAQLGIYTVIDGASGGRHDGPPTVPMGILGPLLSELDSHRIEELRIATGPGVSPTPEAPGSVAIRSQTFDADEFTEHVAPRRIDMPIVVSFLKGSSDD